MAPRIPPNNQDEIIVPLVEETVQVGTREQITGRVRVSTTTETVQDVVHADLRSDEVQVTRVPVNLEVTDVPQIRTEGDVTIVPVLEEVLVVEKRLFLKEELHIRRRVETETVEVPIQLRIQRATVERTTDASDPTFQEETPP